MSAKLKKMNSKKDKNKKTDIIENENENEIEIINESIQSDNIEDIDNNIANNENEVIETNNIQNENQINENNNQQQTIQSNNTEDIGAKQMEIIQNHNIEHIDSNETEVLNMNEINDLEALQHNGDNIIQQEQSLEQIEQSSKEQSLQQEKKIVFTILLGNYIEIPPNCNGFYKCLMMDETENKTIYYYDTWNMTKKMCPKNGNKLMFKLPLTYDICTKPMVSQFTNREITSSHFKIYPDEIKKNFILTRNKMDKQQLIKPLIFPGTSQTGYYLLTQFKCSKTKFGNFMISGHFSDNENTKIRGIIPNYTEKIEQDLSNMYIVEGMCIWTRQNSIKLRFDLCTVHCFPKSQVQQHYALEKMRQKCLILKNLPLQSKDILKSKSLRDFIIQTNDIKINYIVHSTPINVCVVFPKFKNVVIQSKDGKWRFNGTLFVEEGNQVHRVKVKDDPFEKMIVLKSAKKCKNIESDIDLQSEIFSRIQNKNFECEFMYSPANKRNNFYSTSTNKYGSVYSNGWISITRMTPIS